MLLIVGAVLVTVLYAAYYVGNIVAVDGARALEESDEME